MAGVGAQPTGQRPAPGQDETDDVAQVVPGVSQQGQRTDLPAIERFDNDKRKIQCDADGERTVEDGRIVAVTVSCAHEGSINRCREKVGSVPGATVLNTVLLTWALNRTATTSNCIFRVATASGIVSRPAWQAP